MDKSEVTLKDVKIIGLGPDGKNMVVALNELKVSYSESGVISVGEITVEVKNRKRNEVTVRCESEINIDKMKTLDDFYEALWIIFNIPGEAFELDGNTYEFIETKVDKLTLLVNDDLTEFEIHREKPQSNFKVFYAINIAFKYGVQNILEQSSGE